MVRYVAKGYRLDNATAGDLRWLFCESEFEVSGLQSRNIDQPFGSASTDPERLFLQERLVDFRSSAISRHARLHAARVEMARLRPTTAMTHWSWLRLAYGRMRRQDPHEVYGHELAALVRFTRAACERALVRWPGWYEEEFADDYDRIKEASRSDLYPGSGSLAAAGRMALRIPHTPPAWQLEQIAEEIVSRATSGKSQGEEERADNDALVNAMGHQADEMLAQASRAFAEADGELAKAKKAATKSDYRGGAKQALTIDEQIANLAALQTRMTKSVA